MAKKANGHRKIRYGIVGAGNIAQVAAMPAFSHIEGTSELVALVSSDPEKREELGRRYRLQAAGDYDEFEDVVRRASCDAVYIALPNALHRAWTERAFAAGLHVLCEKPMAMTSADCEAMIRAGEQAKKKLMIAYRLHYEEGNLRAVEIARSGQLGELRYFSACFSQEVREGDIRTRGDVGGGALYDLGTYCVNAARYLFRDEPVRVFGAQLGRGGDPRFQDVDETTSALLELPEGRLAQLTCSQGAADVSHYRLVGTLGDLLMEPAFGYATALELRVTTNGETHSTKFPKRDQFAAEFEAFSRCILDDREPEPSGREGLADVRVLEAVIASARSGRVVTLEPFERARRPDMSQEIRKPPVDEKPETIHAPSPSR